MSVPADYFDALHATRPDPFGLRDSWYEQRKRELLLAALSRPSYRAAWEIGCSIGELTATLAPRCGRLLATDGSVEAIERARARTCDLPQVRLQQARHPHDWPPGVFDLIVFSEVGYYFNASALEALASRLSDALALDGSLVACHWRHPFAPAPLVGDQVHEILDAHLPWPRTCRYEDADFVLDVWSGRHGSIAEQEGRR